MSSASAEDTPPGYAEVTKPQISCSNCGFIQPIQVPEANQDGSSTSGTTNNGLQNDGHTAETTMTVIETIEDGFKNNSSINKTPFPVYENMANNKSCTNCGFKFGTPMSTPASRRNRSPSTQINNVLEKIERRATILSTGRTRYESFGEESSPQLPLWKRIPQRLIVTLVQVLLFIMAMIIVVQIIKASRKNE